MSRAQRFLEFENVTCQKIQAWIVVWDITYFTFKSDKNLWPANLVEKQSDYSTYFENFSKWILTCFGPINWTSISSSVILENGINVIFPSSPVTLTPASVFIFFSAEIKGFWEKLKNRVRILESIQSAKSHWSILENGITCGKMWPETVVLELIVDTFKSLFHFFRGKIKILLF